MSHIPASDPELPIDPPSERPDAEQYREAIFNDRQHRAACFEDVLLCLVSLMELIRAIPRTNDGDAGRQDAAELSVDMLWRTIARWRDGP